MLLQICAANIIETASLEKEIRQINSHCSVLLTNFSVKSKENSAKFCSFSLSKNATFEKNQQFQFIPSNLLYKFIVQNLVNFHLKRCLAAEIRGFGYQELILKPLTQSKVVHFTKIPILPNFRKLILSFRIGFMISKWQFLGAQSMQIMKRFNFRVNCIV